MHRSLSTRSHSSSGAAAMLASIAVTAALAPAAASGTGYPEVQTGLGGIAYYTAPVFANVLCMRDQWFITSASGMAALPHPAPYFSRDGYPLYMATNLPYVTRTQQNSDTRDRTNLCVGRVVLTWLGDADVRVDNASIVSGSVSGVVLDGRREYYFGGSGLGFDVKIHAINSNNPPRAIRLWLPDPADPMNKSLEPAPGQPEPLFHPLYTGMLKPFKLLRFMDWLRTNGSTQRNWEDHRPATHCFQNGPVESASGVSAGASYEMCAALCNEVGADMWLCVPHMATDEYVTNLARLILHGSDGWNPYMSNTPAPLYPPLSTNLRLFVEYSNEMWNYGFSQWGWANAQAASQGLSQAAWVARRASGIWKIFEGVWGAAHTQRIVRVGAGWTIDKAYCQRFIDEAATNGVKPHILSVAPYFGNDIQEWVWSLGPAFFTNKCEAHLETAHDEWQRRILSGVSGTSTMNDDTGGGIPQFLHEMSLRENTPLVCYEGGPSIYTSSRDNGSDPLAAAWTAFMCAMNGHPRMADTYRINLNLCKMHGLTTHAAFTDIGSWSKWGQWGHKEFLAQSTNSYAAGNAVKYKLMLDWMAEQKAIRSIDDPLGATPRFDTAMVLPPIEIGRPYSADIIASGGNGALNVTVIAALLPDGITVSPLEGSPGTLRLSGTCTSEVAGSVCHVFARALDADGDPAWGRYVASVVGGPGVIIESDFNGVDPALNRPWTNTLFRALGFACSGWDRGAGVSCRAGTNAFVYALNMPFVESNSTLANAIANNDFLALTVTPPPGTTVDLRGAEIHFAVGRIDHHAPRRYAVLASVEGFVDGLEVFTTPRFTDVVPLTFRFSLPETPAYQAIAGPVEFRVYGFAGQYAGHKTSLSGFKLKARHVTFNQRPVAVGATVGIITNTTCVIDVLANCYDWDGDALSIQSVSEPAHGAATITNATIAYEPAFGYMGTDSFAFTITDNHGGTDTAPVAVLILPEPALGAAFCLSILITHRKA